MQLPISKERVYNVQKEIPPPPGAMGIVGYGTWPASAAMALIRHLGQAGCSRNGLFGMPIDHNNHTTAIWRSYLLRQRWYARLRGRLRLDGPEIAFASYRLPNGYLRDPGAYTRHWGKIDGDQRRLVEHAKAVCLSRGVQPQIILAFCGFGSHAEPAFLFVRRMVEAFPAPGTLVLPVLMVPKDRILVDFMRQRTWEACEDLLTGMPALIIGSGTANTELLAMAFSAFEAAGRQEPTNRVLAEVISPLCHGRDWLGISAIHGRVARPWQWVPPGWAVRGVADIAHDLVWGVMDSGSQLAKHTPPGNSVHQSLAVALPVRSDELAVVRTDVEDRLRVEKFFDMYPNLELSFASASFRDGHSQTCALAARIYPLDSAIAEVSEVMELSEVPGRGQRTGLGTYWHLNRRPQGESDESEPPAEPAPDPAKPPRGPSDKGGGQPGIKINVMQINE